MKHSRVADLTRLRRSGRGRSGCLPAKWLAAAVQPTIFHDRQHDETARYCGVLPCGGGTRRTTCGPSPALVSGTAIGCGSGGSEGDTRAAACRRDPTGELLVGEGGEVAELLIEVMNMRPTGYWGKNFLAFLFLRLSLTACCCCLTSGLREDVCLMTKVQWKCLISSFFLSAAE